jgi:hypothetical protein
MTLRFEISDKLYQRLTHIATSRSVSISELLGNNLQEVVEREWKSRYEPNVSHTEMLAILKEHAGDAEPTEEDQL